MIAAIDKSMIGANIKPARYIENIRREDRVPNRDRLRSLGRR